MAIRKIFKYALFVLVFVSFIFGSTSQVQNAAALPSSPTDQTKVPHYFGPYPNWANSPFTTADATVTIDPPVSGTQATATASVGANGVITGITITNPGIGYTTPPNVLITGAGSGATASAVVLTSGAVTSLTLLTPGGGYTAPVVAIGGGGPPFVPAAVTPVDPVTYSVTIGSATGGTFLLIVDLATTAPIAFNALAADVQAALLLQGVTASVTGSGSIVDPWVIVFSVAPGAVSVDSTALVQPAFSGATATAFGFVDTLLLANAPGDPALETYHVPTVAFDLPDDPAGVVPTAHVLCVEVNCTGTPNPDGTPGLVTITGIVLDTPGSGYSTAPGVAILDGTQFDPIRPGGAGALPVATLSLSSLTLNTFGSGYASAPAVVITDANGTGAGATADAFVNAGSISIINLLTPGSGYMTTGGIKKFQDGLPVLCIPTANFSECNALANNLGQYIPIAIPDTTTFPGTDYYVIAVVQNRERMSSSLPAGGTLLRQYVQLETPANLSWSKSIPLQTALLDGTTTPTLMPDGSQAVAVDNPHFLGPVIVAARDRAVRIVFYNLLPTGVAGDLFLPTDTTVMGSGMTPGAMDPMDEGTVMDYVRNPMCNEKYVDPTMRDMCFTENRATLHLHGGVSPWISDGTPHQWITPANETTPWPQGVSVQSVPDMTGVAGVPDCTGNRDGCMTFYYTNQQSARLMFYHDHAWGITRLNVYAGEAAGYLITDPTEQALMAGPLAGLGYGIPLVIQDRTFIPDAAQLAAQDPTWDSARWGGYGNFWYHHVYMPAQNPGDPGGMSAYGRWMYGPWFWPPASPIHGPILNPYYNMDPATNFSTPLAVPCNLDDPTTWQYQTDPFCEPQYIPGTPNVSVGMEQFNDTPLVNGTAYPTTTLEPKTYRLRILNAANDRFWNLQWYVADPRTLTDSEVALNAAELAAAQTDPNIFPTPDTTWSPPGPSWIQIGTEGGFLPAPVVIPNQPTTWIIDPTRFDVGNVDKHSLLLAPAERADVIVDFSAFAGKTLILYNDAPAAFPARVATYDYYLGAPDMSPVGAPTILPGYGPNTRTIMQVKIAANPPAAPFNLTALNNAFKHHANGSGVFEKGQHPIIVGQAAYNSAYGTNFAASSWCNAPGSNITRCDGFARISEQGGDLFGFNTLRAPNAKMQIPLQPKGLHDEMNSATFDEFGRMTANLGLEAPGITPLLQNIILYPYVNPSTELIDATNLPKGDINVTPISSAADGTQIWKITHNGVDTHPIHFHLYDVQVLNRVTWDNIIIPPEATELGWKDTLRISPLEDTIVALRPIIPTLPFELPNSIRELNPMMADGSTVGFNSTDQNGNPTALIVNKLVNFGWEFVYHCHILSHEEMDMMRPVSVALPPISPDGISFDKPTQTLSWNDNSINETAFVVQRSEDGGLNWTDVFTDQSPLNLANTHGFRTFTDLTYDPYTDYQYRVVAQNTIGYGLEYMSMTVQSMSTTITVQNPPKAPSNLTAALTFGPTITLNWVDNATTETGFVIELSTNGGAFVQIGTVGANVTTFVDTTGTANAIYDYRVYATNAIGNSLFSNTVQVQTPDAPRAPTNLVAVLQNVNGLRVSLTFRDNANNETGFIVERAINGGAFTQLTQLPARNGQGNVTYLDIPVLPATTYQYRVTAINAVVKSAYATSGLVVVPALPAAPSILTFNAVRSGLNNERVTLTWTPVAGVSGYTIQWSATNFGAVAGSGNVAANVTTFTTGNIARQVWYFRVGANNISGTTWSLVATVPAAP